MTTKICIKCGVEKALELFAKGSRYKNGRRNICKECHTLYQKTYYANNPQQATKKRLTNSGHPAWKRHKLTEEHFQELVNKYNGLCHLCLEVPGVHIDHDHACCKGQRGCVRCVRGWLCSRCNTLLGLSHDDTTLLKAAVDYLTDRGWT